MTRTLRCFVFCFFFFPLSITAQKKSLPNTLLWRITGKGLPKPSYLFGTMHVKDRRVFQFSDSLYHFLQTTDGYAMEIDPDAATAALFKTLSEPDTTALLKDEMDNADFKKVAGELEQKFGVPANRITKKQAWLYKRGWEAGARVKPDDMDAAVDLYLYNIAKQSGKWVGGIEDIEDQLNIIDELAGFEASDLLPGKSSPATALEKLLQIYIAQDLNKIEAGINAMRAGARDTLLLRRNHKMARRIGSLAQLRSQFFAVGAAHLPGADGLLQLIAEKGYTVAPVFSKKKIAPEKYTYIKKEVPWQTVENDEKTYAVLMPGPAVVMSPDDVVKMRIYADLGTGLIYFSSSFPLFSNGNKDSLLQAAAKNFLGGNRGKSKPEIITYNGTKGLEVVKDSAGYFYRMRLLPNGSQLAMLMVGSQKRTRLYGEEAQKFYNSLRLTPPKVQLQKGTGNWHHYTNETIGIRLAFPDTPQSNKTLQQNMQQREEAASWRFMNQTYFDVAGNRYYMLVIKETKPGYYIISDKDLFEEAKQNIEAANEITITRYDTGRWQGLPALWMDGRYKQNNLALKSLTVNRSNRGYSLMTIYDAASDTAGIMHFFNSLQLSPLKQAQWQLYTDPTATFSTWAPAPITIKDAADTTVDNHPKGRTAISYDSLSALSFLVNIEPIPAYYWTANDSSFFAETVAGYIGRDDSLLYSRKVINGAAPGMEYLVRMDEGRNAKKLRLFVNGDSSYLLYVIAPETEVTQQAFEPFFTSFRFGNYRAAKNIFRNNSAALLTTLDTGDSVLFEQAKSYIETAPFAIADLPLLHQALLKPYRDLDAGWYSTHGKLFQKAIALSDTATIRFIDENFATLTAANDVLQYPFIKALAGIATGQSYGVLKKLLLQHPSLKGNSSGLGYRLRDSLRLTRTLFPDILALSSDSVFCNELTDITNVLLDSNLLDVSAVMPYAKNFIAQAAKKWRSIKADDGNSAWDLYDAIYLMGKLNTAESNNLLQQLAQSRYMELKQLAVQQLITNKQPVAAALLNKIAADKYYRVTLYTHLKKIGRLSLFPAAYLNQRSLAESELYQYASDDEEPSKMEYIGTRTVVYKGSPKTFYLFKVVYAGEDGTYLGICGPYNPGSKTISTAPEALGLSDALFDAKQIEAQLKTYLQEQEAYNTAPEK